MIDPSQLREYVIRPTLMAIGHGAPAAEELLLGTAIQESGLKYLRSPLPLPAAGDVEGMAAMWKQCYNSAGGAGSEEQYVKNWRRVMGV